LKIWNKNAPRGLEVDDLQERKILRAKYKFSIIVIGDYSELDNLENWSRQNIRKNDFENIYYGKTEYNYGFAEYFVNEKELEERLKFIIPNIFTIYPNANPSQEISRTEGYDIILKYDSSNENGIVLPNDVWR
jgi:hypothetical protein